MSDTINEAKRLSRKITWIGVLLIVILSTVFGISVYIYNQIDPLVSARLKETLKSSTKGLYKISFSDLSINPFNGNVILKNVALTINPSVYNQFKKNNILPNHLYVIRANVLKLKHVHPLKMYLKHDLVINSIEIEKPAIWVFYDKISKQDSSKTDPRNAWQRISKYLNSVKIGKVLLKEINFKYIDKDLPKPEINNIKNLSITLSDIFIDSLSHLDQSKFFYTKDILVDMYNNQFKTDDGMYTVKFDKLEMSALHKYAMMKGLRIIPNYPEIEFSLKWDYRKARYLATLNELWLRGIDYKALIATRDLHASSLNIKNASLDIFMNQQLPKASGDLGKNFPQQVLKRFRLITTIDSVKVENSRLSYSEYNPATLKTGKISFTAIRGHLLNVTNDSLALMKNRWSHGKFAAYPYGKGRLDVNINLNLTSPHLEYNYKGKLHRIQAKYFNPITRPLALLNISSGEVDSAQFSVTADYRKANGSMTLAYKDLSIRVLKLNTYKQLKNNTLLSLVANNLLLIEDNPSAKESLRTGKIVYIRPDSVSFYNMIWHTIFTGIKENIGMTEKRERKIQMQFKNIKPEGARKTKVRNSRKPL